MASYTIETWSNHNLYVCDTGDGFNTLNLQKMLDHLQYVHGETLPDEIVGVGMKSINITPDVTPTSNSNCEIVGGKIQLEAGESTGYVTYQFNNIDIAKILDVNIQGTRHFKHQFNTDSDADSGYSNVGCRQSDYLVRFQFSDDGLTWDDYFVPANLSAFGSMEYRNGLLPRGFSLDAFNWAETGWPSPRAFDEEGYQPMSPVTQKEIGGPFAAIINKYSATTDDTSTAEKDVMFPSLSTGRVTLIWKDYIDGNTDYMRFRGKSGEMYDSQPARPAYYANGLYEYATVDYIECDGNPTAQTWGAVKDVWQPKIISFADPRLVAADIYWHRNQNSELGGFSNPVLTVESYDPTFAFADPGASWSEDFEYADAAAMIASGNWVQGGTPGTGTYTIDSGTKRTGSKSLKVNPEFNNGTKWYDFTSISFDLDQYKFTSIQAALEQVDDSPALGGGIPDLHHHKYTQICLQFLDAGLSVLDAISVTRENGRFSHGDASVFAGKMSPKDTAKGRIIIRVALKASENPAGITYCDQFVDSLRVDQVRLRDLFAVKDKDLFIPRLDIRGYRQSLTQIVPKPYVRVRIDLMRDPGESVNPSIDEVKIAYI